MKREKDIKNNKLNKIISKIKDILFVIQFKIKNFALEHKFLAAFIGVFLISCVIAIAVNAASNETIDNATVSIKPTSVKTEGETSEVAPNFSIVRYSLRYSLVSDVCSGASQEKSYKSDEVTITASVDDASNITWIGSDETSSSEISKDGKTLTIKTSQVNMCSVQTKTFAYRVLNAEKDTSVPVKISIKGGSKSEEQVVQSVPVVKTTYDRELELATMVRPGVSKKTKDGRDIKFGLLVGVNSTTPISTLKGAHFKTSADIILNAYQEYSSKTEYLDLYTDNGSADYFGINTSDKNFFASNQVPDLSSTSGKIESFGLTDYNSGIELKTISTPKVTLVGQKDIEFEKLVLPQDIEISFDFLDDTKIKVDDKEVTCDPTNDCEVMFYKKQGAELTQVDYISFMEEADYEIHYIVSRDKTSQTIVTKNVKVVDSKKDYSLLGKKTLYLTNGESLPQFLGLYDNINKKIITPEQYQVSYLTEDDKPIELEELLNTPGEYKQKYVYEEEEIIRNIVIVDKMTEFNSSIASVTETSVSKGGQYKESGLKINDKDVVCKDYSEGTCSTSENPKIDTNKPGTYVVKYEIKDKEGNIYILNKNVYVTPPYYKLVIKDLFSTGSIKSVGDNFYAIGAYYVTVNSPRAEGEKEEINVNLKAITGDKESIGTTTNKEYSTGNNSASNAFYIKEEEQLVKVDSSEKTGTLTGKYYTAAMGEEVILSSILNYGYDADDNIKELTAIIPVNGNLIPTAYSSEITGDNPYYFLNVTRDGKKVSGIPNVDIKYCSSNDKCYSPDDYNGNDVVSKIKVVISENQTEGEEFIIQPGYTLELKTKYIVRTYSSSNEEVAKDVTKLSFNGSTTFEWKYDNGTGKQDMVVAADSSPNVYITPYKVRTRVSLGLKGEELTPGDIVLDASKNDTYTAEVTTNVISPAMNVNSNIFGYNRIHNLDIKFILPKGINYVYNKDYIDIQPEINYLKSGETELLYHYTDIEPNAWINQIRFDFNIETELSSGIVSIKAFVGDFADVSINNDVSSSDYFKTEIRNITINNTEKVSYGQYIYTNGRYTSNIDVEDDFTLSTKLHNNDAKNATKVNVYTILPYQTDDGKGSKFNGSYEIELPDGAMCTNADPTDVEKEELVDKITWTSCDKYKNENGKYDSFTAYRVTYDNLAPGQNINTSIKVNTVQNKPDDKYLFRSYLSYVDGDGKASGYINFRDVYVDVISKKITGIVWEDFNVDGILDEDEKKIENVTLKLFNKDDELVKTTTPDKDGRYTFSGVEEGSYYIVADFNVDKYGITSSPSEDFYDKTRLSVFKEFPLNEDSDEEEENNNEEDNSEENPEQNVIVKTDNFIVNYETRVIRYMNLGLSLKKKFSLKINKYITRAEVTNGLGVKTIKEYGNVKLAKLDVKDINNLKIKVVYTLEIQNIKYYPGYATLITETIPDGMSFNPDYPENKGWQQAEDGVLTNTTLKDQLINENEKKYLTIAFDITRKEAGSFVNVASIDGLEILGGGNDEK